MENGDGMVLLMLNISRFGNRRKGNLQEVRTDADLEMLRLSKVLLDCDEMDAVQKFDGEMLRWITNRTVSSYFKNGVYQCRPGLVPKLEEGLKRFELERRYLVDKVAVAYQRAKGEAELRLGTQYQEGDYPGEVEFKGRFKVSWRYLQVSAPGALKGVDPELFREQMEALRQQFDTARQMACAAVREQLAELVTHMAERLQPGEDGKRKTFKLGSVENLREFCATFPFKDVTNDTELALEVQKLEATLRGVNAEGIRNDLQMRDQFRMSIESMKGKLDSLVTASPVRALAFGDE